MRQPDATRWRLPSHRSDAGSRAQGNPYMCLIHGSDDESDAAKLRDIVREAISRRAKEHVVLGHAQALGQLIDQLGPELTLHQNQVDSYQSFGDRLASSSAPVVPQASSTPQSSSPSTAHSSASLAEATDSESSVEALGIVSVCCSGAARGAEGGERART